MGVLNRAVIFLGIAALSMTVLPVSAVQDTEQPKTQVETPSQLAPDQRLVVLWTSGDREVALKMVFMYTYNAKRFGWWDDVTLIIWGPSAKLLATDEELQAYVGKMKEQGVVLEACKACAEMYEVSDKLGELGVDVRYLGKGLTNYVKQGRKILTF